MLGEILGGAASQSAPVNKQTARLANKHDSVASAIANRDYYAAGILEGDNKIDRNIIAILDLRKLRRCGDFDRIFINCPLSDIDVVRPQSVSCPPAYSYHQRNV